MCIKHADDIFATRML